MTCVFACAKPARRLVARLGAGLCRFDQQDSGNLGFGVERDGRRYFVKFAGARPLDYGGDPADAVARLRAALPAYAALRHPALANLVDHMAAGAGYAALFEWFPGECLHTHWLYGGTAKYADPRSSNYRFARLPLEKRLRAYSRILEFHRHVEAQGYVAIDFYDGSVLYDFAVDEVRICDVDFYARRPVTNTMGRMWGSSRFMSPEEFQLARLSIAHHGLYYGGHRFCLLGGEPRSGAGTVDGRGSPLRVACRAAAEDRTARYPSGRAARCLAGCSDART
jgi:serine/threonine-protein kinase